MDSRWRRAAAGLMVAAVCGCGESPTEIVPGLVQMVEASARVEEGVGHWEIRSTLQNVGQAPEIVRVRSCYLREADLQGEREGLQVAQPTLLCASDARRITLLPGEVSEPLTVTGLAAPGSAHTLRVRHALQPERWATVSLRIE